MERGLYIAASGMLAEMVRQDQIANDLANASTPGYKADRATQKSFGDILLANTVTDQTVGPLGLGSRIDTIVTDDTPAPARDTGEPLDFAVVARDLVVPRLAAVVRFAIVSSMERIDFQVFELSPAVAAEFSSCPRK